VSQDFIKRQSIIGIICENALEKFFELINQTAVLKFKFIKHGLNLRIAPDSIPIFIDDMLIILIILISIFK